MTEQMKLFLQWLPVRGFIAHVVEQRTGIAEVTGLNPAEALIFAVVFFPICLNCWFTVRIISLLEKKSVISCFFKCHITECGVLVEPVVDLFCCVSIKRLQRYVLILSLSKDYVIS